MKIFDYENFVKFEAVHGYRTAMSKRQAHSRFVRGAAKQRTFRGLHTRKAKIAKQLEEAAASDMVAHSIREYCERAKQRFEQWSTFDMTRQELADNTALLRKTGAIDTAIAQYCEGARVRFKPLFRSIHSAGIHAALC